MHCRRFAVAAAVIALPFALTACSSSGTSGTSGSGPLGAVGQKTVQLNPPATAGTPSASQSLVASSAFCAAIAKASDDSAKQDAGDTSITNATAIADMEAALAAAPAPVKNDMQTIVDAGRTAIANGQDINSGQNVSPEADAAGDRVLSWASANCTFH